MDLAGKKGKHSHSHCLILFASMFNVNRKKLLGAPGLATRNKRTLLGAPGLIYYIYIYTRSNRFNQPSLVRLYFWGGE